ncbi:alpha/beta hydrolase [Pedobacter sp. KR3-3]|uniref:Alpha/beta hydrolase n=1 Tax=Pedobacter albus TaxID=3113905 RepID=A0ABU7I440_9SPHI|nr:alpha/beta hydrolase [Pedobacter sp. KR3-3]MEE1944238.1 alpha/beta hydrolase [Pedobacter sp. KR3-3]
MKTKHQLFLIFILQCLLTGKLFGQMLSTTVVGDKAYFSQNIDVEKFAGKRFQLKAVTKVKAGTNNSKSAVIALIRKKNNTVGFHTDLTQSSKNNANWEVTNIKGKIDSDAKTIEIGGYCSSDGIFSFDDFKLKVEVSPTKWEQIPIGNYGFEKGDFQNWIAGSNNKPLNFDGVKFGVESKNPFNGKFSLRIECKYTDYGNNDKAGNYITVNGIKLYYEIYGSGKPLVLLHGNGGSISGHKVRIADFKSKYKVIAIDNRAQGKSGDDGQELTYDLMADDINKLLEKTNIDSAYIWGQSDGGIIGLLLAMKHPDKVKKLAVWGANIQANEQAFAPKIYESIITGSKNGKTIKERQLNTLMVNYPNMPFSDLNSIKAPVLVMSGDRDAINIEHTIGIFQHIPNSQLFVMPGATHFGAYEKPGLFNSVLLEFFNASLKKP